MNTFSGPGYETRIEFLRPRGDMHLREADASVVLKHAIFLQPRGSPVGRRMVQRRRINQSCRRILLGAGSTGLKRFTAVRRSSLSASGSKRSSRVAHDTMHAFVGVCFTHSLSRSLYNPDLDAILAKFRLQKSNTNCGANFSRSSTCKIPPALTPSSRSFFARANASRTKISMYLPTRFIAPFCICVPGSSKFS
jgi:hypothetical protein